MWRECLIKIFGHVGSDVRITVHRTKTVKLKSPHTPSLSIPLFQAKVGEKTMMGCERWREKRPGYAFPMACHCAHYSFSPSPVQHRQSLSINNSTMLSFTGSKPAVLPSHGNSRATSNTLVSEVYSSPLSPHKASVQYVSLTLIYCIINYLVWVY